MNINGNCVWYHSAEESDVHVLFGCDFTKTVWVNSGLQNHVLVLPNESAFDVLLRVFHACTRDQSAIVGMLCWSIWNRRNK